MRAVRERKVFMKYSKGICISLLRSKYAQGGELPKKSDFTQEEIMAIKSFFGPWPRALEAAGIKEPRDGIRIQHNREKRIRAKRRLNEIRRAGKRKDGKPNEENH